MTPRRLIFSYGFLASMVPALAIGIATGCTDGGRHGSSGGSGGSGSTSSGSTSSSSVSSSSGMPDDKLHLSGTLTYEHVPYDTAVDGLDYGSIEVRPIRGVSVRLLDAATSTEIAKTVSDDQGVYTFAYDEPARVKLWIYSETELPVITVEDNTSNDEVYVLESAEVDSAMDAKLDVLAGSGWTGSSYSEPRASGPFTVLDAAYASARRFMDEVTPPPQFPPLKINWSINNRPEDGNVEDGQIGTSYWDDEELYILGKEDVDTDEFDSHVIVHEWGHSFEGRISRSDNPGGNHGYGDVLDPRTAFSEGFCNALSAMILEPDANYTDSSGMQQSDGFLYDLEANDVSAESNPGWYSEGTQEALIYDLYDSGANEPFDKAAVGIKAIYGAMVGGHKSTPALTSLFSFVSALKKENPAAVASIDGVVAHHTLNGTYGISVIQDEWGAGETHSGGVAPSLPVYGKAPIGGSYTAVLVGGLEYNALAQNRFFQITGDGMPVTVQSTCPDDVDLYVFHVGKIVAMAEEFSGNETVTFPTTAGQIYVLNVNGYSMKAMSYSAQIDVFH